MELQFNGQFIVGDDDFDTGLTDVAVVTDNNGDRMLVAVSQGHGGVVAWDLSNLSAPTFSNARSTNTEFASASGASIIPLDQASGTGLLFTGLNAGGVRTGGTNSNGGTTSIIQTNLQDISWTTGTQLDNGLVALADAGGTGYTLFSADDTALTFENTVTDTAATHATAITAMASFGNILLVGSATEYGISSYDISAPSAAPVTSFGPDSGLGTMVPTAITAVSIDGVGFAIVGSAGGSSGALSVFRIGTDGSLIPTDHAMDTLNTRFGAVQDMAVAPIGDGALVVAGGGDDGLTVMALMPNGRLVHLASFEDTLTLALSGVTALDLVIDGTQATIFATTQGDAGFSSMSIDLSDIGVWQIGTGGLVNGTSGNDILMTNDQATTLDGGAGDDIFVVSGASGADQRIRNFDPNTDTINLSDWSFLYDAADLVIDEIWNGVLITHRDETLVVTGITNQALNAQDVRATIDVDVMRLPTIPNADITGGAGDDSLTGNWAQDTIFGGGGDDRIDGGAGDDVIFGGAGFDTAVLNGSDGFTVEAYDDTTATITLRTADGIDQFDSVEAFEIGGATYTFADLAPAPLSLYGTSGDDVLIGGDAGVTLVGREGNDQIRGGAGGDTIKGGTGDDDILGNDGNDDILAGAGDDTVMGGAGDDLLNAGANNDLVMGGSGTDTYVASLNLGRMFIIDTDADGVTLHSSIGLDVISGVEYFQFDDSTVTLSDLAATQSRPTINGTDTIDRITDESGACEIFSFAGDDAVRAGSGTDFIDAGLGDDRVWGGTGRDEIHGGDGDDRLQGEAGNDRIYGDAGADLLRGQANNDLMFGGDDDDIMYGGDGHDLLYGDNGTDFISGGVRRDQLWGGAGNDDLRGGDDDDIIYGGSGNDAIRGGEDHDIIYGGSGNDSVLGGAGLDTIQGGAGNDRLSGGGDRDTFIFEENHGSDHITDYNMLRDSMILDAQLVGAAMSAQDVVDLFASQTADGVQFSFDDGSVIVLDGVTTLTGLEDSISIL